MIKFSKNKKLNTVLNYIFDELNELGALEVVRYVKEFPYEIDNNIYQYGNLTIYNYDIEQIYKKAGYKSKLNYTEIYKRQVGYIARKIEYVMRGYGYQNVRYYAEFGLEDLNIK